MTMPLSSLVGSIGRRRAFSLVEVLAAVAIFVMGVLAILLYFPNILRANNEATLMTQAALLAQEKVMEIRRDNNSVPGPLTMVEIIRARTEPTQPVLAPRNPFIAYAFSGVSVLDPAVNPGVARVIVLRIEQGRIPTPAESARWDVLTEVRFDVP